MARTPRGPKDPPGNDSDGIAQDVPRDVALAEFAKRLRKAMDERGLSQSELGRRATEILGREIGRDSISQYLRAITFPNPEVTYAIAKVVKKDAAEILPTRGARRSTNKTVPVEIGQLDNGDAWLRINQQMPWTKALKIMAILKDEA